MLHIVFILNYKKNVFSTNQYMTSLSLVYGNLNFFKCQFRQILFCLCLYTVVWFSSIVVINFGFVKRPKYVLIAFGKSTK